MTVKCWLLAEGQSKLTHGKCVHNYVDLEQEKVITLTYSSMPQTSKNKNIYYIPRIRAHSIPIGIPHACTMVSNSDQSDCLKSG